jgi:hypothetical protein
MAKGDKNKNKQAIDSAQNVSNVGRTALGQTINQGYDAAYKQGQDTRASATGLYNESADNYRNFLIGPSKDYTGAYGGLMGAAGAAGNISAEDQARMRGNGGYEEFAKTGGFSPTDMQSFRARALAPVSSAYSAARDSIAQGQGLQGGYSPNSAAAALKLARSGSQDASAASINAEATLADQIRSGREYGISGMTSSESALQDALARGRATSISGYGAAGNLALGQEQNRLAGMRGLNEIGDSFKNLYGTGDANTNAYLNAGLTNQSGREGANLGLIGARISNAGVKSNFENAISHWNSTAEAIKNSAAAGAAIAAL